MWKSARLGDVVSYEKVNGQGSNRPYVGMENISSETMEVVGSPEIPEKTSSTFKFDERHVLFGRLRPYLRKVLVPNFDGQCSTEIFCLLPSDKVDKKFLAHWLLHPKVSTRINETSTGARMPRANMNAILGFDFPLPPLAEQQRIVAKLDAAFAEIDKAISLNDERVSHQSALVNNFIDEIFSNVIGEEMLLNDACDLITCGVAARPQYVETGVPFLSAQNVKNGTVLYRNHKYITEEKHKELTKHNKPAKGDILYTRVGSYGDAAVIEEDTEFSIFVSLTLIKVNQYLTSNYLKYFLNSQKVKRLAARSISGSGVGNLNVGTVRRFPIVVPDIAAQQEITSRLGEISLHHFELMSCLNAKSAALKQLKSSILAQELQSEAA